MAIEYANTHRGAEWSVRFLALMEADPPSVTEDDLYALFAALKAKFWPAAPAPPPPDADAIAYVVWFCCGMPAMLQVVKAVSDRLAYGWQDYTDVMRRVVNHS